jgi:hypothetical protein
VSRVQACEASHIGKKGEVCRLIQCNLEFKNYVMYSRLSYMKFYYKMELDNFLKNENQAEELPIILKRRIT